RRRNAERTEAGVRTIEPADRRLACRRLRRGGAELRSTELRELRCAELRELRIRGDRVREGRAQARWEHVRERGRVAQRRRKHVRERRRVATDLRKVVREQRRVAADRRRGRKRRAPIPDQSEQAELTPWITE